MEGTRLLKRRTAPKVALVLLCFIATTGLVVQGTLAYLQDSTQTVKNVFTAGNVTFDETAGLNEHKTNEYGEVTNPNTYTTDGNTYTLVPGHVYTKDPAVTIEGGSEPCYVYMAITNPIAAIEDSPTIASQMTAAGWTRVANSNTTIKGDVWAYGNIVPKSANDSRIAGFSTFSIKDTLSGDALAPYTGKQIDISAYAVQADGFSTAQEAWNSTFGTQASS